MALKHLRSSTANKRPQASGMADGQLAMNTASGSPGLFFKDAAGNVVKIGPVHVGSGAPNASPASGGTTGNSIGEQWLDNSGGTYVFKIWDGAAWRSESGEFVNASGDTMTGSLTMGPSATLIFEGSVDDGFETTLTVTNPTADRTITLPNVTGTVVTTGDSGTVTSTMIASDTILNVDINSAAAIAGTKISPNFGGQNITTSGTFIHALASSGAPSITFSGDSNTGIYSPGPDNIAISNGGVTRFAITDSGFVRMGPGSTLAFPSLTFDATVILDGVAPSVGSASLNGLAIVSRGGAGFGGQATERLVFHSAGWSSYATISHTTNAGGNSIILDGATYIAMRANDRAVVAGINSAELEVNNTTRLIAKTSELVINDDANDYDFRVEGDTKANLFFVDASTDRIGINTSAPDNILHIHDTGGTTTLRLSQAFASGASDSNMIFFESKNYNKTATIIHTGNSSANALQIGGVTDLYFDGDQQFFRDTAGTTSLFIGTDGQVAVGKLLTPNVPDLAFIGDPNTGVSSPDDDQFAIITAGVERVEWGTTEVVFNDGGVNYDFRIEGDTNANLFFVDASADRVGIGTANPAYALDIASNDTTANIGYALRLRANDTALASAIQFTNSAGTTQSALISATTSTNASPRVLTFNALGGLVATLGTSEAVRIDSSGRLLVGWSNAIAIGSFTPTLQNIGSSTQNSSIALSAFSTTDDIEPRLNFTKSATATIGANALVANGESLGSIRFHGSQTAGYIQAATIECYVDGDPETSGDVSDMPGRIVLKTTADASQTPIERVRITSAGRVGLATTAPAALAHIAGDFIVSNVDLANASYDSISFSVAGEETSPNGLFLSPDGRKMFVIGGAGDDINEYTLSTPWNVSTATYVTVFSVSAQDTAPNDLYFRNDGKKLYVIGSTNDVVYQYSLTIPWSIASASYDSISFSVATEEAGTAGLSFKPDGLAFYIVGTGSDTVYRYNLSTAWNISTATLANSLSVSGQESAPNAVTFTVDGSRMFVMGATGDDINIYNLTTPWDITTASFVTAFSVAGQETIPTGLFVKPDGTKFYILGTANDTVYQYSIPSATIDLTGTTNINGSAEVAQDLTVRGGVGFYGTAAIAQPAGTGEATGFTAGTGTAVNDVSTFTGNLGTTAYRINDVVKALKQLGLLKL